VTFDLDFKVTTFFDIGFRNDTSHSYYRTSIGSHMRSIAWWHFHWPWWTPNPVFKVTAFLMSNIRKTARLKDKVAIAQDEKYLAHGMVLCLVTLTDL